MDLRFSSIERLPAQVPIWDLILDDLGRPPAERIAKALGVGRTTVYRWNRAGSAPKVAALALFWLTRWGHSQIHADATNDAILAAQLVRSLSAERDQLELRLKALEAEQRATPELIGFTLNGTPMLRAGPAQPGRARTSDERLEALEAAVTRLAESIGGSHA
jgi:hypothetical protein